MIVCVKCSRQMRPKKNGVEVTELATLVTGQEQEPYKVWMGDLWECQDCGSQVVFISPTQEAFKHKHEPGFEEWAFKAPFKAKEWSRG